MDRKIRNHENGKAPEFMCVICGMTNAAYLRDDGVYVVPHTALSIVKTLVRRKRIHRPS